jgi:hypothetical protein
MTTTRRAAGGRIFYPSLSQSIDHPGGPGSSWRRGPHPLRRTRQHTRPPNDNHGHRRSATPSPRLHLPHPSTHPGPYPKL